MSRNEILNGKINNLQAKLDNPLLPHRRRVELQEKLDDLRDERYAFRVKEKIDALEARVAVLEAK